MIKVRRCAEYLICMPCAEYLICMHRIFDLHAMRRILICSQKVTECNCPTRHDALQLKLDRVIVIVRIEDFHMTSRRPYWCQPRSQGEDERPWERGCIGAPNNEFFLLWEMSDFLMQKFPVWKHQYGFRENALLMFGGSGPTQKFNVAPKKGGAGESELSTSRTVALPVTVPSVVVPAATLGISSPASRRLPAPFTLGIAPPCSLSCAGGVTCHGLALHLGVAILL